MCPVHLNLGVTTITSYETRMNDEHPELSTHSFLDFQISGIWYQTTWCHDTEGHYILHRRGNLKSCILT